MKKGLGFILILCFVFLVGCNEKETDNAYVGPITATETEKEYQVNEDGTWSYAGVNYKYCLELTGRSPNAAKDSYFKVLTNNKDLTFEIVSLSLYSSNMDDIKKMEGSVIVEMK